MSDDLECCLTCGTPLEFPNPLEPGCPLCCSDSQFTLEAEWK